jgi:hypothetical protein
VVRPAIDLTKRVSRDVGIDEEELRWFGPIQFAISRQVSSCTFNV